ncbi:MAG: RNA polymerase sigma factor [Rikenellaceae bacterium]
MSKVANKHNTSEERILKLLSDDTTRHEGFEELMKSYREVLYWHIRRMVVVHEDAQDVLQECFVNVHRYIGGFKGESSLKTWLYRVATNEALRHCTKKRLETQSYDEHNALTNLFEAEKGVDFESAEAKLQKAILALTPKQRVAFNLRYYEELSYEEMALVTESSIATLKTNYHYAATKIKEYILNNMEE